MVLFESFICVFMQPFIHIFNLQPVNCSKTSYNPMQALYNVTHQQTAEYINNLTMQHNNLIGAILAQNRLEPKINRKTREDTLQKV